MQVAAPGSARVQLALTYTGQKRKTSDKSTIVRRRQKQRVIRIANMPKFNSQYNSDNEKCLVHAAAGSLAWADTELGVRVGG